jgi:very-short-patch-repair endonuclease
VPAHVAERRLRECLVAGNRVQNPTTGFPVFAYRLHQWIGRGTTVFATLEPSPLREITLEPVDALPGRDGGPTRKLFPLAFCRECGAAYATVFRETNRATFLPRMVDERTLADGTGSEDGVVPGFLSFDNGDIGEIDYDHLPDDWVENERNGNLRVRAKKRHLVPTTVHVAPDGREVVRGDARAEAFVWFPAPFAFCVHPECRVTYTETRSDDRTRVAQFSSEGRSTATTIVSLATVQALRGDASMPTEARKLLSFIDNRQDASLQAGHFNDFVQVSLVRATILEAVKGAGTSGLRHDALPEALATAFTNLVPRAEYDRAPEGIFADDARAAIRDLITHRAWHDLRRGWRLSFPNLEQVGLLRLRNFGADQVATNEALWANAPDPLRSATPAVRERVIGVTLDTMRRALAIATPALEDPYLNQLRNRARGLREPWAVAPDEDLPHATLFRVPSGGRAARASRVIPIVSGGSRSLFGRYLRRARTWGGPDGSFNAIKPADYEGLASALFGALARAGLIRGTWEGGYQVDPRVIIWSAGDGDVPRDPVRRAVARARDHGAPDKHEAVNAFFRDYYQQTAHTLRHLEAREHTAQVPNNDREDREKRFTSAELPVLYCSPTMELGVDIAQLNAVHLRNVPPSPANYAQRSGRAGRSGQPAIVITYATDRAPHDAYYFKHPLRMVSGQVATPRLDLLNEDLVRAHVHATWLALTGVDLPNSVVELLDLRGLPPVPTDESLPGHISHRAHGAGSGTRIHPTFALHARFTDAFQAPGLKARATDDANHVLDSIPGVREAPWYRNDWAESTIARAAQEFDRACDRWRALYRAASDEMDRQQHRLQDAALPDHEHKQAEQLWRDAVQQLRILRRADPMDFNDFYTYRYLASEGFLPGYNFPRLPLRAYLPGRSEVAGNPQFLSRARFIALAEYGPRSLIYHEGARYRVLYAMREGTDPNVNLVGAKICRQCGYGHVGGQAATADTCDNCTTVLHGAENVLELPNLFRLSGVRTQRVQRITCDEEERLRLGYDLRTTYRFEGDAGRPRHANFFGADNTTPLGAAIYGPATTLWRVNLKWTQSRDGLGFALDLTSGKWLPGKGPNGESDADTGEASLRRPAPNQVRRVVPYVEDRRNALILTLDDVLDRENLHGSARDAAMASVQSALERAIETTYQLEDADLATEAIPERDDRRKILLYEAAEGGAGVLSRLVDDRKALGIVARKALELLHFDPNTAEELAGAPCVKSCYDCLRSYYNQRDHDVLDRHAARPILWALVEARAEPNGVGHGPRPPVDSEAHLRHLEARCQTPAEREFLQYLHRNRYRLPDEAQGTVGIARPDFVYRDSYACVFIDGSMHRYPDIAARDDRVRRRLATEGYTVIAIPNDPATWDAIVSSHPGTFGNRGTQR